MAAEYLQVSICICNSIATNQWTFISYSIFTVVCRKEYVGTPSEGPDCVHVGSRIDTGVYGMASILLCTIFYFADH